jgi:hypothetical protein
LLHNFRPKKKKNDTEFLRMKKKKGKINALEFV